MPTCEVLLVTDPKNVGLWIAGPVSGDKDDNDCAIGPLSFDPVKLDTKGQAKLGLEKGERYCLQYYLHDQKRKKYLGGVRLYCGDADLPFDVVIVELDPKGIADGHECFRVRSEGGME